MTVFKVTFTRTVVEEHTLIVERDSKQAVLDDYETGDLPYDSDPYCTIIDEHSLKIEEHKPE